MTAPLRGFKAVNLPASDSKPERVRLTDLRNNKTIIINYSAESPTTQSDLVEWYLLKLHIELVYHTWNEKNNIYQYSIYLTPNFTIKLR